MHLTLHSTSQLYIKKIILAFQFLFRTICQGKTVYSEQRVDIFFSTDDIILSDIFKSISKLFETEALFPIQLYFIRHGRPVREECFDMISGC